MTLFVMPGSGHFLVGRKLRGVLLVAVVSVILFAFSFHVILVLKQNMPVIIKGQMDLVQMMEFSTALSQNILEGHAFALKTYLFLLGVCYIVGAADLFWIYFDDQSKNMTV
ncbi:MAG: hypothetical protein HQM16_07055 [Deltaproteobacteria bacterium]|nr:hypothetical protein [Deltaproteobacteria bacterium]